MPNGAPRLSRKPTVVVYTASIGLTGDILPPLWQPENSYFICFTDKKNVSPPWITMPISSTQKPVIEAKTYKILPHLFLPDHDINIWHDANMQINKDISEFIDMPYSIKAFKHSRRGCSYKEADAITKEGIDNEDVVKSQMDRYKSEGFPRDYGLCECGVLIRYNTYEVSDCMRLWFDEVSNGSTRDQLSFMYSVWRTKIDLGMINSVIFRNDWIKYHGRNRRNNVL